MRLLLLATVLAVVVAGCASAPPSASDAAAPGAAPPSGEFASPTLPHEAPPVPSDTIVSGVGTVQYVALEGGFYGIVNRDTDRRYIPDSLAAPYRLDGLAVRFRLRLHRGQPSFRMWGTPATVLSMETVAQGVR